MSAPEPASVVAWLHVTNAPSTSRPTEQAGDLARTLEAIDRARLSVGEQLETSAPATPRRFLRSVSARQLLITVLSGLLVAGVVTVVGLRDDGPGSTPDAGDASAVRRATVVFGHAQSGNCLTWPENAPDRPSFVLCRDDHLFEVAESVDMRRFQEPCELTVRRYLGTRYDPDGKFTVGVLWPGNAEGPESADRRLLCGLQLLGPNGQPIPFKGMVADLDQSKVWPPGTCLGIDAATNRPTDTPTDCAQPHAAEVTGTVDLGARFPARIPPAASEQEAFISEACAQMTDAYLAPTPLRSTPLTVQSSTISPVSWSAGSRLVACRIGAIRNDQSWATLTGSAKGQLAIDGDTAPAPKPTATPSPEPTATSEPPRTTATAPPTATASPSPTATSSPSPTVTSSAPPTASATESPTSSPLSPVGPLPGPPPETTTPPQQLIEIPGLPPITLPVFPPPPPPPPPA